MSYTPPPRFGEAACARCGKPTGAPLSSNRRHLCMGCLLHPVPDAPAAAPRGPRDDVRGGTTFCTACRIDRPYYTNGCSQCETDITDRSCGPRDDVRACPTCARCGAQLDARGHSCRTPTGTTGGLGED